MSPPNPPSEPVQTDKTHQLQFNLDALLEIGNIFISETDFQETSETALRVIMGAVATSRGALLTYDETARCLQGTVAQGIPTHQINIQVSEALKDFLVKVQAPIVLDRKDAWPAPLKACEPDTRSLGFRIWIPLVIRNTLLGVLSLGEKFLEEPYTPNDLRLLWTLSPHFCVGLYNQYLIAESRQVNFQLNHKIVELETLYNAGLTLASSLQVEEVVEEILLLSVSIVDAQSGFLFVRNERTNRFSLDHHIGLNEHQCELLKSDPQVRRALGRVLKSNKIHHLSPENMPTELVDIQYALIAPVGNLGLLVVCDKESREGIHPFTESDAQLLELIGQQAGASLANARLYKSILEVKTYNQNILSSIANGVISTDLKGRIVSFNPSVERVFEAQSIPLGKSCVRFFQQNGCNTLADAIRNTLKDGKPRQIAGEQVQGSGLTLNARLAALRNEEEEIHGVVIALEDLSEEMRLRSMFKQYASDQVVDLLLNQKDAPSLGGTKREVTILFVDIVGSTALLGRIGAEKMAALLNSCFSCLIEVIFQYNGTLDKYTGDGFMVVYGAPVAFPDDTERAVRTALAMQKEIIRFNRESGEPLGLAMGISRGEVMAGNIGSLRRMEYTVIGESVNLANRLCDGARSGQIWVGPNVHAALKESFIFEPLGHKKFKNIATPIEVYDVIGEIGNQRHTRPDPVGGPMSEKEKSDKSIDLTIPMLPEMELAAIKTAEGVAQFMGLTEDKLEEVKMALIEACINSFEHSQSKDPHVTINFRFDDDALTIQISDTGQGFDLSKAREEVVQRRERGESQRGWGLKIMEELMDKVDIHSNENGTVITMVKER